MSYLCNSGAGLFTEKSRFFSVFQPESKRKPAYFFPKIPVFEFKIPVYVLKFRYGLFLLHYLQPMF